MPKSVGNEANYKVAEGITAPSIDLGINVVATQYMHESDSFGNTYDKDATYPAANADELKSAPLLWHRQCCYGSPDQQHR